MNHLNKTEFLLHYAIQKPAESLEASMLLADCFEKACAEQGVERMVQWIQENTVGLHVLQRLLNEPHENVIKDTIGDVFESISS